MTAWPALSHDARLIAYVSDGGEDGTTPQVWVQQIGGAALRLTHGEREYSHLSFSPDDTRIMFTASDESGPSIHEIPTLGGEPRLVLRAASNAVSSPDGQWLACIPQDAKGIRVAARGGAGFRTVAPGVVDVASLTWLPDSRSLLVHARADSALEAELWVVPIDGASQVNTGLIQRLREAGLFTLPTGTAWIDDSLIFSTAGPEGVRLHRQRFVPSTFDPRASSERLTAGSEVGVASHGRRRPTRIPQQPRGFESLVGRDRRGDGHRTRSAAPDDARSRHPRVSLGHEGFPNARVFLRSPRRWRRLPARSVDGRGERARRRTRRPERISGDSRRAALSSRSGSASWVGSMRARPIFIARPAEGTWRTLGDDCGGRPRQWVDERLLIIERFARLNSVALIDTETAEQRELLQSAEWSIRNPRLSPDGRWIAFDASRPGEPVDVYIAPFGERPIPEADWIVVDRSSSHPFWSADGRFLYYTPTGTNPIIRSASCAADRSRRHRGVRRASRSPCTRRRRWRCPRICRAPHRSRVPDQIIFVLGDFRGDIWLMDL